MTTEVKIQEMPKQIVDVVVQTQGSIAQLALGQPVGFDFGHHNALPETFALGALHDGRLRVVEPILTKHTIEAKSHVIEALELNEFGFGDTPSEALRDLQDAISELYHSLEAEQERLGSDLLSVWEILNRKVRKAYAARCA